MASEIQTLKTLRDVLLLRIRILYLNKLPSVKVTRKYKKSYQKNGLRILKLVSII